MRRETWLPGVPEGVPKAGHGRMGVEVSDCGGCFLAEPTTKKLHGEGGRGMRIIEASVDQLEVHPDRGSTRGRVAKRLLTVS